MAEAQELLGVGDVAERLGCAPRLVSDWLYRREFAEGAALRVGGRWLVRTSLLPAIEAALAGKCKSKANR